MAWRTRRNDERGATAVIVAVAMVGMFGAAALSLDAGNLWQNRRNLVTGTDAAALREAGVLAGTVGATSCSGAYLDALERNSGDEVFEMVCTVFPGANGTGYVMVEARKPSEVEFGKVVGLDDAEVYSMSAAQFGNVSSIKEGMRPIGICKDNPHIQEWMNYRSGAMSDSAYNALRGSSTVHPVYTGAGVVHRLYFNKNSDADCGHNAPGNWGWIDLNGGSNSNSETKDWIENGYGGEVGIGDCYADGTNLPCEGDPGASGGSVSASLDTLVVSGEEFLIPIYSTVTGNGANTRFTMWAFMKVRLWGYKKATGKTGANGGYFDFEFKTSIVQGKCCSSSGPSTGLYGLRLCAVDHDPQLIASRCA